MKRCFVIMPFAYKNGQPAEQYWTDHFEHFLKPTIEKVGDIEVIRSTAVSGNLMKNIIHELITADIVVADLTDTNVNVYYELGIRQSFKHGTVTIAEEGTKLPFDISQKGTLFYQKSPAGVVKFGERLVNTIKHCINTPDHQDSDILDYVKGKHSLYNILNQDVIVRKLKSLHIEFQSYYFVFNKLKSFRDDDKKHTIEEYADSLRVLSLPDLSIKNLITESYLNMNYDDLRFIYAFVNSINQYNIALTYFSNLFQPTMDITNTLELESNPISEIHIAIMIVEEFIEEYTSIMSKIIDKSGIDYNPFKKITNA